MVAWLAAIAAFAWIAYTLTTILERLREIRGAISDIAVPNKRASWAAIEAEERALKARPPDQD